MSGPYAGYDSLEAAVAGLRRARFRITQTFAGRSRGLVVEGDVLEGTVRSGMVLLPVLERYDNIYATLSISAVESVLHSGGVERVGLVVEKPNAEQPPNLSPGTVVDVLERSPTT